MLPIFKKLGFILMFITYTCAWTQLSFYGNLYIGSEKQGNQKHQLYRVDSPIDRSFNRAAKSN
jgi:hypothetical protein